MRRTLTRRTLIGMATLISLACAPFAAAQTLSLDNVAPIALTPSPTVPAFRIDHATGNVIVRSAAGNLSQCSAPGSPVINSFSPTSSIVTPGATITLNWSSSNATSCFGSQGGSTIWSSLGTLPASGSQNLTAPSGTGQIIFQLNCTNGSATTSTTTTVTLNTAPTFTPAAAISRQVGSAGGAAVSVGAVADAQTASGSLVVTQIAGGTATNIAATGITNTAGAVSAVVTAACGATAGTLRFQASDGSLTGTGDLQVNVTANNAPVLTYANASLSSGAGSTLNPATGPSDNGSVASIVVQSQGTYSGGISVNSSGLITLTNAAPAGVHTITIRATDNCALTTDASFQLTVNAQTNTPPVIGYAPSTGTTINYASDGTAAPIAATPSAGSGTGAPATTVVGACTITDGGVAFPTINIAQLSFVGATSTVQNIVLPNCAPQGIATNATLTCPEIQGSGPTTNRTWALICPMAPVVNTPPPLIYSPGIPTTIGVNGSQGVATLQVRCSGTDGGTCGGSGSGAQATASLSQLTTTYTGPVFSPTPTLPCSFVGQGGAPVTSLNFVAGSADPGNIRCTCQTTFVPESFRVDFQERSPSDGTPMPRTFNIICGSNLSCGSIFAPPFPGGTVTLNNGALAVLVTTVSVGGISPGATQTVSCSTDPVPPNVTFTPNPQAFLLSASNPTGQVTATCRNQTSSIHETALRCLSTANAPGCQSLNVSYLLRCPVALGGDPQVVYRNGFENPCNLALDTDNDRLPDCYETGTNVYISPTSTGTLPNNADTDNDGLKDGDEVLGAVNGLDLPGMGANPLRKTVLVEYDWLVDGEDCGAAHSHRPTEAIANVTAAAYAAMPVTNPNGSTGIDLIQDYGQGGLFTGGNPIDDDGTILDGEEAAALKLIHFNAIRANYFHYGIMAHTFGAGGTSGQGDRPGKNFVISLGCIESTDITRNTIVHELGHNFGLYHGGDDNCGYKPNYNSVMNYRYQFDGASSTNCGLAGGGVAGYSTGLRITLNENSLDENAGVCGLAGGVPIDWNGNGSNNQPLVVVDINPYQRPPDTQSTDCGGIFTTLTDYNDYANLNLSAISASSSLATNSITCSDAPLRTNE